MNKTRISYLDYTWNPVADRARNWHNSPLRKQEPSIIGVAFMGDLFDPALPVETVERVYEVMEAAKQHTFVVFTKQPESIMPLLYESLADRPIAPFGDGDYLPNVWHFVSVTDQESADRLIRPLLEFRSECPGWPGVGASIEPCLGRIDLTPWLSNKLDGVILGGQTGPGAVPMDPDWARAVRDQCQEAGVPFYMKQMARREPIPPDLMVRELPWEEKP